MVAAEEDRPLVRPVVDAVTGRGLSIVQDPDVAEAAVLIASPRAAASAEVDRLLDSWTGDVVVVLIDGVLEWDTVSDAFDPAATTALSARAQRRFSTRPLWLDGRAGIDRPLAIKLAAAVAATVPAPPAQPAAPLQAAPVLPEPDLPEPDLPEPDLHVGTAHVAGPPPSPPSRRRQSNGAVLAGLVLVGLAVIAVVVWARRDGPTGDIAPPPPPSPVLLVVAGIALGLAVAMVFSWLRRRRRRPPARPVVSVKPQAIAPATRPTVFISHDVDADHALAVRLADDLRPDVEVWLAPESIEPGESWLTSVERGLGLSRVFLALLSQASLASPWVIKEIQAAMDLEVRQQLRLVPVQLEECDVPILLRTYQIMRLATGYAAVVDQTRRLAARSTAR
jgi:hypothetical protein